MELKIQENRKITLLLLLTSLFFLLTLIVAIGQTQSMDEEITSTLSEESRGWIFKSMTYLTYMGHYYFLVPGTTAAVFTLYKLKEKLLSALFGGMMIALIPSYKLVKYVVKRPRPNLEVFHSTGYSYPSGHTVGAFTFFLGLYVFYQLILEEEHNIPFLLVCVILAVIVGASRIILGVHFLTDVIGGVFLSGMLIISFYLMFETIQKRYDI